jgi:hypothetical protein
MSSEGQTSLLERHAALLKEWRRQLDPESGRTRHATKRHPGRHWQDDTERHIAVLKRDIAMMEAIDEHLRARSKETTPCRKPGTFPTR